VQSALALDLRACLRQAFDQAAEDGLRRASAGLNHAVEVQLRTPERVDGFVN
jgi:hypothetical protein